MQQHPLPQNVTSYQFHLIGNMTIKQFLFLVGGVAGAWLTFSLPIANLFKWPIMGFSVLIGVSLAFLPYQDQPLDHWFMAFIKSIYSPTQYLWKKSNPIPDFLKPPNSTTPLPPTSPSIPKEPSKALSNYLQSLPSSEILSPSDIKESQALKNITNLFGTVTPPKTLIQNPITLAPTLEKNLKIKVRKLKTPPPDFVHPTTSTTDTSSVFAPPPTSTPSQPQTSRIISPFSNDKPSSPMNQVTSKVTVNIRLPFPSAPTVPNVIVGMTLDPGRNILENTIIEIRDNKNHPVRALKSNKLGQFYIATPLPDGVYEIEAEKEGFAFDIAKITLNGKLIPPIEIRAKTNLQTAQTKFDSPTSLRPLKSPPQNSPTPQFAAV